MDVFQFIHYTKQEFLNMSPRKMKYGIIHKNMIVPKNSKHLRVYSIRSCYKALFPNFYERNLSDITNEFLLDYSTSCLSLHPYQTIIIDQGKNRYAFSKDEIFKIFHYDLIRSNIDYEPRYNITTLRKSFRLPTNPYSNQIFTLDSIKQIIGQLFLFDMSLPERNMYPEVYLYLFYAEEILKSSLALNSYDLTSFLYEFFHQKRFVFKENFNHLENNSLWIEQGKSVDWENFLTDYIYSLLIS